MAQTFELKPKLGFKDGTIRLELIEPIADKPNWWKVKRYSFSLGFKRSTAAAVTEMHEDRIQQLLIAYHGDLAARDIIKSGFGRMAPHRPTQNGVKPRKSKLFEKFMAWRENHKIASQQTQQPTPST